jgi:N6-adenosine-specific RNA methylase IME4
MLEISKMKPSRELVVIKPLKPPEDLKVLGGMLAKAKTPEQVLYFERRIAAFEAYMRKAGYSQGDQHEVNEYRMRARWRLGQMLAALGAKRGGSKYRAGTLKPLLIRLRLDKKRAIEAQRISHLPKIELERIFQRARNLGEMVTIQWLVDDARPYWYKASRKAKHQDIAETAAAVSETQADDVHPFPLVYVDPPWKFKVYSEKGLERTPDQHYPTMTDAEIVDYITPFVPKVGAILMWCTSSNMDRAITVLESCDYEFKSSAVWVKLGPDGQPIGGLGLVFRNMHEILLYGTRGDMPGPQYQPPSVFFYPRRAHSAKPPEIRTEIERMYPDFDAETRCELFCRGKVDGWTTFGFEAEVDRAAE